MLSFEYEGALSLMIRNPSPMSYFYILSHPIISTTLGFRFTKYYNLSLSSDMRRTENWFRSNLYAEGEMGDVEIFVSLLFGEAKKYNSFIRDNGLIEKKSEAMEFYTKDFLESPKFYVPAIFRSPESSEEVYNAVIMKCFASGVIKSFSFDTSSKMYASGVYILKTPCLSVRMKTGNGTSRKYKCSLTRLLTDCENESLPADFQDFHKLFPQRAVYDTIIQKMENAVSDNYDRRNSRRLRTINFNRNDLLFECSLIECIKTCWFNVKNKFVKNAVSIACFTRYKEIIPWLTDDAKETFNLFKEIHGDVSVIDFYNSLSMYEVKDQLIKVLHRGPDKSNSTSMLCSFLSYQYSNKTRLILQSQKRNRMSQTASFDKTIVKIMGSPPYAMQEKIFCSLSTLDTSNINCVTLQDKLLSTLALSHKILKGSRSKLLTSEERDILMESIKETKQPSAYWINPQQIKSGKFTADGVLMITIGSLKTYFHVRDKYLIKVVCNNEKLLKTYKLDVKKLTSRNLKGMEMNMSSNSRFVKYDLDSGDINYSKGVPLLVIDSLEYDPSVTLKMSFDVQRARFEMTLLTFRDSMHDVISHDVINYYPSTESVDIIQTAPDVIKECVIKEIEKDVTRESEKLKHLRLSKSSSQDIKFQREVVNNLQTLIAIEPSICSSWVLDSVVDEKLFSIYFNLRKHDDDFRAWFEKSLVKSLQLTSQFPKPCFYAVELIQTASADMPSLQYLDDIDYYDVFVNQMVVADVDLSDIVNKDFVQEDYNMSLSEMDDTTSSIGLLSAVGSRIKARNLNLQTSSRFYESVIKTNISIYRPENPISNWKSIPLQMHESEEEIVMFISEIFRSRGLPKEPRIDRQAHVHESSKEYIEVTSLFESGDGYDIIDVSQLITKLDDEDGKLLCEALCKLALRKIASMLEIAFNKKDISSQSFNVCLTQDDYTVIYDASSFDSAIINFCEKTLHRFRRGTRDITPKTEKILNTLIEIHKWDFDDILDYCLSLDITCEILLQSIDRFIDKMNP